MWSITPPKITPPSPSKIPQPQPPLSVPFLPQPVLKPFQSLKSVPQPSISHKVLKKNAVGGRNAVKWGNETANLIEDQGTSVVFVAEEGASTAWGSGNDAVFAEKGGSGNDAVFAEKGGSGNDAVFAEKGGSVNAAGESGNADAVKSGNTSSSDKLGAVVVDTKAKEFKIIDVNIIDFDYRYDVSVPGIIVARGRAATNLVMTPMMFLLLGWIAVVAIHVVQSSFAKALSKFLNKMLGIEDETKPKAKPNNEG